MAKKEVHNLLELIRLATSNIMTKEERVGYLMNPTLKNQLYGKYPECFISLKRLGQDTSPYLLPLCNRAMSRDPLVINISYKMIGRLMNDSSGTYDINDLQSIFDKLSRLKARYEKEEVKPYEAAGRKAFVTRVFNNIRDHLLTIGPKE